MFRLQPILAYIYRSVRAHPPQPPAKSEHPLPRRGARPIQSVQPVPRQLHIGEAPDSALLKPHRPHRQSVLVVEYPLPGIQPDLLSGAHRLGRRQILGSSAVAGRAAQHVLAAVYGTQPGPDLANRSKHGAADIAGDGIARGGSIPNPGLDLKLD